ncbi:MAG: DUF992 domain-containing protein, partial [Betaproteobacteria bacterium]|nr:DUF992 domain-containing protein [Betaproteobacteria bacterium]
MKISEIGKRLSIAVATALIFSAPAQDAMATGGIQVGILTCHAVPGSGTNWLLHSSVAVNCIFSSPQGEERYRGQTGIGLGIDLSYLQNQQMAFTVLGGASDTSPGAFALSGKYFGGKGGATVGVGGAVSVLIGGGGKNIALQPL